MTAVKICGLRSVEHALAAAAAGATMIGFVFAPARRQITLADAAAAIGAVRAAGHRVATVGVFVNESPERIAEAAEQCGLTAVQLSGDEDASIVRQIPPGLAILKALRLRGEPSEDAWLALRAEPRVRLLVDAHTPGAYGGTGAVADWERAAEIAREQAILLAGGLTPENVGAAIRAVHPWGVDVSSGVETDGVKDPTKIRAFVAAAASQGQGG